MQKKPLITMMTAIPATRPFATGLKKIVRVAIRPKK
jgi:hypothetical protein